MMYSQKVWIQRIFIFKNFIYNFYSDFMRLDRLFTPQHSETKEKGGCGWQ